MAAQDDPDDPDAPDDPAVPRSLGAAELGADLGARATLVQFSSTFCAPCRTARRVLERVAATAEGVAHVDLDVADHLELGERLAIDVTPTVLVLDADGTVRARIVGPPSLAQTRNELDRLDRLGAPARRS